MTAAPVYRIRGRRPNMYPQAIAAAELLFGRDFSAEWMGHLRQCTPDGLVIACSNGRWYETYRGTLREITAANPGLIVETKGAQQPELDPKLFWREVIQAVRERERV